MGASCQHLSRPPLSGIPVAWSASSSSSSHIRISRPSIATLKRERIAGALDEHDATREAGRPGQQERLPSSTCERRSKRSACCARAFADALRLTRIPTQSAPDRLPHETGKIPHRLRIFRGSTSARGSESNTNQLCALNPTRFLALRSSPSSRGQARLMPTSPPTTWCDERLEPSTREARCAAVRLQHQTLPDGG